jgi:hypothetical protein
MTFLVAVEANDDYLLRTISLLMPSLSTIEARTLTSLFTTITRAMSSLTTIIALFENVR